MYVFPVAVADAYVLQCGTAVQHPGNSVDKRAIVFCRCPTETDCPGRDNSISTHWLSLICRPSIGLPLHHTGPTRFTFYWHLTDSPNFCRTPDFTFIRR